MRAIWCPPLNRKQIVTQNQKEIREARDLAKHVKALWCAYRSWVDVKGA